MVTVEESPIGEAWPARIGTAMGWLRFERTRDERSVRRTTSLAMVMVMVMSRVEQADGRRVVATADGRLVENENEDDDEAWMTFFRAEKQKKRRWVSWGGKKLAGGAARRAAEKGVFRAPFLLLF